MNEHSIRKAIVATHGPGTGRSAQRGSALLMVLLLSLIVSAVGAAMLTMSNTDHAISGHERDAERALYAANAGLNYGFYLFEQGLITPNATGAVFNSFASGIGEPLDGAEFAGRIFDLSNLMSQGQLYRIESTGAFSRSSRTTELVFQVIPDAFKYGYMAFNEATLHNHSGLAGPTFKIQSTVMSNGPVSIPKNITIDGAVVSADQVSVDSGATVTKDIFANSVSNSGTIQGNVRLVTAIDNLPGSATSWDREDAKGGKWEWFNGADTPGSLSGNPPVGGQSSYTIQDDELYKTEIFSRTGALLLQPNVNVVQYVAPPKLDYKAMYDEALLNDNTYFASQADAVTYLISKKVTETIGGRNVVTVRVGTPSAPEFLYVDDDFELTLDPGGGDDPGGGQIDADAVYIEGGIYITGSFDFDGPQMIGAVPPYPLPPDYYMLSINALPYCYPALVAYEQPGSGTIATWTPEDTPAISGGSAIKMSAGGDEGPSYFNGVVFAQGDIHLHHTSDPAELIRFNGAELAWKIHNCDFFWFSYDPAIRCTRFLTTEAGTAEVVAFREVR